MIGIVLIISVLLVFCLLVLLEISENIKLSNYNRSTFESKQLNQMETIRGILKQMDKN